MSMVLWSVYALAKLPWYAVADPAWLLDVARHVAEGQGVTTSVTMPAYLAFGADAPVDRSPHLQTPLLYPAIVGLAFRVAGATEATAMALQGILFAILVGLVFLAARSVLPPAWSALVTVVAALDPALLAHATTTEHNLLFAVGVMAAFVAVVRLPMAAGPVAGVALGLLQLVRFNAAGLLPAFALLAYLSAAPASKRRRLLSFLGGWALGLAISVVASRGVGVASATGAISLLFATQDYPGLTIQGALAIPSLGDIVSSHLGAVLAKGVAGLRYYLSEFTTAGNPVVAGGVPLAVLVLLSARAIRPILWFVVVATVTTVGILSFFDFAVSHLAFLLPLYAVLVVAAAREHAVPLRVVAPVLLSIGLLQYSAEAIRSFRDMPARATYADEVAKLSDAVRRHASTSDWIASDIPSTLTWHTRIPAVRLPNAPEDLPAVERAKRPIAIVVVTNIEVAPTSQKFTPGAWEPVLAGRSPAGFRVAERYEGSVVRAVILERAR